MADNLVLRVVDTLRSSPTLLAICGSPLLARVGDAMLASDRERGFYRGVRSA